MPRKRMPIFPLFEEVQRVTAALTDAQFGRAIRHALSSYYIGAEQEETDGVISLAAAMMLEQAARYDSFREQQRENGLKPKNGIQPSAAKGSQGKPKEANNTDGKPGIPPSPSPIPSPDKKVDKPPARHRYGAFENVILSDAEYSKLKVEFPADYSQRIERLSEYIASTGKRYKNHLATIRSWARRDEAPKSDKRGAEGIVIAPLEDPFEAAMREGRHA